MWFSDRCPTGTWGMNGDWNFSFPNGKGDSTHTQHHINKCIPTTYQMYRYKPHVHIPNKCTIYIHKYTKHTYQLLFMPQIHTALTHHKLYYIHIICILYTHMLQCHIHIKQKMYSNIHHKHHTPTTPLTIHKGII